MKKIVTLLLTLAMCLSLVACGGVDKQPAIDAFNSAVTKFDAMSAEMNENIELYPEDVVNDLIELSNTLSEHKAILEGDQELSQEDVDMLVGIFNEVEAMVDEIHPQLGAYLEASDTLAALDAFDAAAAAYNDFAARVNAEIDIYPDSFIAEMNQVGDLMSQMYEGVAAAESLTPEEVAAIAKTAEQVMNWVEENDVQLVNSDEIMLKDVIDYFNSVTNRFDTIAYMVNDDPSAYTDDFVAAMVELSESMSIYRDLLSQNGETMTQEDLRAFLDAVAEVDMWMQEVEPQLGLA